LLLKLKTTKNQNGPKLSDSEKNGAGGAGSQNKNSTIKLLEKGLVVSSTIEAVEERASQGSQSATLYPRGPKPKKVPI